MEGEASRLAETTDRPAPEIAQEFGVLIDELYAWMKEFKRHRKMSASLPGGTSRPGPQKAGQASRTAGGKFSEEFKRKAVHLTETTGRPVAEIARELGVGVDKLYAWKRELRRRDKMSASPREETNRPIPLTSAEVPKAPDAKFSEELKREAVRLAETTDRPAPEIAQEFGVRVDELYAWMKEFKRHRKMSALLRGGTSRPGPQKGGQASRTAAGKFSEEFKRKAVHLTETTGRPVAEIARECGVRV